ncbi:hypothetical protein KIH23_07525 [Flavobacterium sp. CYK-55]|uniref:pirin family protein n=1 Tax=Flavobacterium sp. CYK-55 TaxID=2835529 RepID=UPI001BCF4B74|nr:hypothetical protein [Flavobacterium sp. CYK-55]MBS7787145.1 hypothetical protein [Flavobacterium sp. CYK-55]
MGAQIFKSAWRTTTQSDESLRQSLPLDLAEIPINITQLDEIFLRPQAKYTYGLAEKSECWLLPLAGAIDFIHPEVEGFVHIGQLQNMATETSSHCIISNPYTNDVVHFLAIQRLINFNKNELYEFDLSQTNQIIQILKTDDYQISIGQFEGRAEEVYRLLSDQNSLMVFVVRGAFELHNRLLEAGDTLLLNQTYEAEFEALSNNALLLFIENFTAKK